MGREISLFANFHQQENRVTNYCGLVLKMLYDASPHAFEKFLGSILPDEFTERIGPVFQQQTKEIKSIPDLSITQKPFAVFVETKIENWFYDAQIERHIASLSPNSGTKVLILLSNFEGEDSGVYNKQKSKTSEDEILILKLSFQAFADTLRNSIEDVPELAKMETEFRDFLDRCNLLPRWKSMLEIVNCASSLFTFKDRYYSCPDTGGAYSHQRARYLGPYANKMVREVSEIQAVVAVEKDARGLQEIVTRYFNVRGISPQEDDMLDKQYKERAWAIVQNYEDLAHEITEHGIQIFLLGEPFQTAFEKDSPGGMFQSKLYFWDIARDCENAEYLAEKLNGKTWSEF